ncbi:dynein light chain 2, cytoplasmic-like [Hibiscus syriacus]|uniref:dynein light chain 2, cytoplasmic-like n=1 Tax=Hibiscus syriacus TaxID=106335 RepID=UPI001921A5DE|nr:dynein light chain 2, cytoplasmic-like [Hibiscus syriacus]
MLEGKAVIGDTDMLQTMQQDALDQAAKALDFFDVTEATGIAQFVKKEFDRTYGGGWQCIVGTDFGSFVTHSSGCFIYFCVGNLAILLFKGSSVATSLIDGESKPKHVLHLEIKGNQYRPTKIPLTSVRPFEYTEVVLKDEPDIDPNDQNSILEHLDKVASVFLAWDNGFGLF